MTELKLSVLEASCSTTYGEGVRTYEPRLWALGISRCCRYGVAFLDGRVRAVTGLARLDSKVLLVSDGVSTASAGSIASVSLPAAVCSRI